MIFNTKFVGTMDIHPCPECLKKGITTYIPADQQYCPYCKKKVMEEQSKIKYPIGGPWYLGDVKKKRVPKDNNPWYL